MKRLWFRSFHPCPPYSSPTSSSSSHFALLIRNDFATYSSVNAIAAGKGHGFRGWVPTRASTAPSESWRRSEARLFSSDEGSTSHLDIEKDLFRLRREMTSHFTSGNYPDALKCAQTIETTAEKLYGIKTTIFASSLNNTALMFKMMGELKKAIDKYTKALQLYEDLVGSKHESYCSVLSNLGITYKLLAQEVSSDKERNDYLRHAETATVDAYALRVELKGENSKEVFESQILYASILRMKGKVEDAEFQLKATLGSCRKQFDKNDTDSLVTATVINNLGHLLKQQQKYEEALPLYEEALSLRKAFLNDKHPDTIVTKHNLAELLLAMGRDEEALSLQAEIIGRSIKSNQIQ